MGQKGRVGPSFFHRTGVLLAVLIICISGVIAEETPVIALQNSHESLVADFSADIRSGNVPLTVTFTDITQGVVTERSWDFGDGAGDSVQNPVHIYSAPGVYSVTLSVTSSSGSDQKTRIGYISVQPRVASEPEPSISPEPPAIPESPAIAEGMQTNPEPDTPVPVITASDTPEAVNTPESPATPVPVPGIPAPDFTSTPAAPHSSESVIFTGSSPGEVTAWIWDFGDGTTGDGQEANHTYQDPGTYLVTLKTGTPAGEAASGKEITVSMPQAAPAAAFTSTPGATPLEVIFNDSSRGPVTGWSWDFGDGASSSEQNPAHSFSREGTYLVSLTVTGDGGMNTTTEPVVLTKPAEPVRASFSSSVIQGYAPLEVSFTDTSSGAAQTYAWDFGDGNTSPEQHPVHIYDHAGAYTVTLTVTGETGESGSTREILVKQPAVPIQAGYSLSPQEGQVPLEVSFTDASQGEIMTRTWDFGDGTSSEEKNPVHTYQEPGTYTVTLSVIGPTGSHKYAREHAVVAVSIPEAVSIPVQEETLEAGILTSAPVSPDETQTLNEPVVTIPARAGYRTSATTGAAPLLVSFTPDLIVDGMQYLWDFGDGETSYERQPNHTYQEPGTYTTRLSVFGSDGSSDTRVKENSIQVSEPVPAPEAGFSASPQSGNSPCNVSFTDLSIGKITTRQWIFGDGTSSREKNPVHAYTSPGTYDVSLQVSGMGGSDEERKIGYIRILEPGPGPVADYTPDVTSGAAPLRVSFTDTSAGQVQSWKWDFGDGTESEEQHPIHLYNNTGKYSVTLTVTGNGIQDSKTEYENIEVSTPESAPVVMITGENSTGYAPLDVWLSANVTGEVSHYLWDLGDGSTSYDPEVHHTYTRPGLYSVRLFVSGAHGSDEDIREQFILVNETPQTPVAEFVAEPLSGTNPLEVSFMSTSTGSITSSTWEFGDGQSAEGIRVVHEYEQPGTYPVRLTVSGPSGSSTIIREQFIPVTGGNESTPAATGISTSAQAVYQYNEEKPHGSPLSGKTVTKPETSDEQAEPPVTPIVNDTPEIVLPADNQTPADEVSGLNGTEEDLVSAPVIISIGLIKDLVDVQPGSAVAGEEKNYSPDNTSSVISGNETVPAMITGISLPTVRDDRMPSGKPKADFFLTRQKGHAPLMVTGKDRSTGEITSWLWDFGDGEVSTAPDPVHIYLLPGTYTVSLQVTGPDGVSKKRVKDAIEVY